MEKKSKLIESFNQILQHLNLPVEKTEPAETHEDPIENLTLALKKLKDTAQQAHTLKNEICAKAGINTQQAEKGQLVDKGNEELAKLTKNFHKELKSCENDIYNIIKENPDFSVFFQLSELDEIGKEKDKSQIKKKKQGSRSKWLSA